MSKNALSKSKLKNVENVDKFIKPQDIDLNEVTIEDLKLTGKNYDKFINLKNLLDSISSCHLSDAYNNLFRKKGAIKGLKSINGHKVYGRINTAETDSDDWGTGVMAIEFVTPDNILFIKSSDCKLAIWGEIASIQARNHGVKGVGIYGSVRDMDAILDLDLPIFALDFVPNAGKPIGLGKINPHLTIDGEIIKEGDFFFGDESGVVIIPKIVFNDVIVEALNIKLQELNVIDRINKGESLIDIVNLRDSISFE